MKKLLLFLLISAISIFSQDNEKVKFSGQVFSDYFYNIQNSNSSIKDLNGYRFRRIFFTADFNITEKLYSRFRLETDGVSFASQEKKLAVYLKDMSINYKAGKHIISAGLIPTTFIELEESFWEYRSVEKIQIDLRGLGTTRDMGFSARGPLNEKSTVNYWVMFGNNSNHGPETDKYKRATAHLSARPTSNLAIAGDFIFTSREDNKNILTGRLGLYMKEKDKFSGGISGILSSRLKATVDNKSINSLGLSFFGNLNLLENLKVLGRLDYFDPNIDKDVKNDSEITAIFGVNYILEKYLNIIPNVILNKYELSGKKEDITFQFTIAWSF